jgi:hypothetical protein
MDEVGEVHCVHEGEEKCVHNFDWKILGDETTWMALAQMGIILKWILEKWGWRMWISFIWLRIGARGGLL